MHTDVEEPKYQFKCGYIERACASIYLISQIFQVLISLGPNHIYVELFLPTTNFLNFFFHFFFFQKTKNRSLCQVILFFSIHNLAILYHLLNIQFLKSQIYFLLVVNDLTNSTNLF